MAFYSIGGTCLPKFGLDDFVGKTHTYFYDWLIADLDSLERSLLRFKESLFLKQGYEVCDDGLRVKDLHTGLRFQHDFPALADHTVDPNQIQGALEGVRSKYIRRRKRFLANVLVDSNPYLIRFEHVIGTLSAEQEQRYALNLRRIVESGIKQDINIIVISRDVSETRKIGERTFISSIETEKQRPWRPTKASWDQVLSSACDHHTPLA